ncbi:MFS transporter [Fictibacillus sp. WQ 8-8]|uniref:CynX/NimT family MFS transporter n=1 Tax=Fictibacillus sp. WQ 8-8 TaxID=2938788 RepID=UPI00210D157B|nr:MFS transporter [Fictibacillus sp. WQ 8-8]MCQ6264679.1 MFS transporter [Fictibacillus sp. WQ 8-8]
MISKKQIFHTQSVSKPGVWLLILGIVFAGANLRAPLTCVGPIIEIIRKNTGMSNTLAGMLTTLPLLAFALISPVAPKIARRFGLEHTLFGALLLLGAGILLRSVPFTPGLFSGTILLGIAIAVCNVLLPSLIKREFPNKVGLMTGTYSVSMNMWAAIASGVSIPITKGLGYGWRFSLVCWALISLVSIIVWIPQLLQKQHVPKSSSSGTHLWGSGLAWKVTLFMGLQSTVFYAIITWLPAILHQQGVNPTKAGWLLSLTQFASLPPTFIVPILAGRSANQRKLVAFTVIFLLLGYAGILSGMTWLAPVYVILIGIGIGSGFGLATMFFVLRTQNAHQAAELSGMAQSVGYLLAAIGPALFGFLHDQTHSWTVPLIILVVAAILLYVVGMGAGSNSFVREENENDNDNSQLKQKAL